MYQTYWQLNSRPFENVADPRFYYPSEVHQGALLKLRYAVENRCGAALVAGGSGSGKTLLVQALARQLPDELAPLVHLVFPQLSHREMLAYLADELQPAPAGNRGLDEQVHRIQRFLAANAERGLHAVLAIDEAQLLLDTAALETVRLLLNFEHQGRPVWTLLLVGQPALLPALERLPGLEERLAVKCLLRAFSLEESVSYVNHRMTAAGATREIFEPEALTTLHHLARGNPRRINRLCDLALLIGYADEQSSIGASQVEAVAEELTAVAPE